jgi:serine/threonine protein kinase
MMPDDTLPPVPDIDATVNPDTLPESAAPRDVLNLDALPCTFGRYVLERKLGQGGMGMVFLARDTHLERQVALKMPLLSALGGKAYERFVREAKAAAAVQHPNLCPIFDLGEIDGQPFLSMAFISGEPLTKKLQGGPLPIRDAVRTVRQVALAMQCAHDQHVIHRDLKPANIMMNDRGEPVVMDFGLARTELSLANQLTRSGDVMGTPSYMPPEQIDGKLELIGPGTDIYSLGVVLFELLTGMVPFPGNDLLALASQIALDPPPRPSQQRVGLDPRLDEICVKALGKKPSDRFASMQVLADALAPLATEPVQRRFAAPGVALLLQVEGTPYVYRPPPGLPVITVGRQRRKPGEATEVGNDFVLRVSGNDALSSRISRRHLEIHCSSDGYSVIDRSKAGTLHNGKPLPKEMAVPLAHGDRLTVADVVTLLVRLENQPVRGAVRHEVHVPAAAAPANVVALEASLGDMMTME